MTEAADLTPDPTENDGGDEDAGFDGGDDDAGFDDDAPGGDDAPPGGGGGMDPAMMQKLMASLGQGGAGGEGGGMDMAALQAMMGGMGGGGGGMGGMGGMMGGMGGGGPEADLRQRSQQKQAEHEAKNAGEIEGGSDGKTWKWEQTSDGDESTILVRFTLATKATKRDVKVVFKAKELKVTVAGESLVEGKLHGTVSVDDSTWCIVEEGMELQVMLALASDTKWDALLAYDPEAMGAPSAP